MNHVPEWVYEAAGIEVPNDAMRFEAYENKRRGMSAEVCINVTASASVPGFGIAVICRL